MKPRGAYVMGRNMIGPIRGDPAGEDDVEITVEDPGLQPTEVIHSPHTTHIRYRVGR